MKRQIYIPGSISRPPSILPFPDLHFSIDGVAGCLRVLALGAVYGLNTWVLGEERRQKGEQSGLEGAVVELLYLKKDGS